MTCVLLCGYVVRLDIVGLSYYIQDLKCFFFFLPKDEFTSVHNFRSFLYNGQ